MLPSCLCVTSPHQLDFSENVTDGSEAFCKLAIEVTRLQTNSYGHFFIYFCFWRINIIITGIYFFFAYRGIHKLGLLIIKSIIIVNPTQVKQSRNCKIRFFIWSCVTENIYDRLLWKEKHYSAINSSKQHVQTVQSEQHHQQAAALWLNKAWTMPHRQSSLEIMSYSRWAGYL